jgi:hypothetical protein
MRSGRWRVFSALIMFFLLASTLPLPTIISTRSSTVGGNGSSEQTKALSEPGSEPHPTFLDGMRRLFPNPQLVTVNDTEVSVTPEHVTASLNESFAIAVVISNVSSLYGFEIQLHWNPSILEYVSHAAMTPVEAHANGVLHEQVISLKDEVNASTGTYWIAFASISPAPSFNGTGTAFEMTFRVAGYGGCLLEIHSCKLASYDAKPIDHSVKNGHFTASLRTLPTDMPIVFVDPLNETANVGDSFTISVKVFNLSANFYTTEEAWEEGEPLPPLAPDIWRYNHSLGYLYALDLRLSWDPTILECISHTVMVPVDDYPGGILNGPDVVMVADTVNNDAGTYTLSVSSVAPARGFNLPDDNATAFTMTFTVKKEGKCDINFTNVDLPVDLVGLGFPTAVPQEIPHWTGNGQFQTNELLTRIKKVEAGALVADRFLDPVIQGEDSTVKITMRNDGVTTETYNLSVYDETVLLVQWVNEELDPDATKTFTHTIGGLDLGLHSIRAEATILHGIDVRTDVVSRNFTVVGTPVLQVSGPSSATGGQTVSFSASGSFHSDPNGEILSYRWTLWAPGETMPRNVRSGVEVAFSFPLNPEEGNWTVMLVVNDNFGLTAMVPPGATLSPTSELLRPATAPYRFSVPLQVARAEHELDVYTTIPDVLIPEQTVWLNTTVYNKGLSNETNVELQLLINGGVAATKIIPELKASTSDTLSYSWSPTMEGTYNITAYAVPVPGENFTANNKVIGFVRVIAPIISPEEGQYANYLGTAYNNTDQLPGVMGWNFTYLQYVTPYMMNVTIWQRSGDYSYTSWASVNVLTREMSGGYYPSTEYYYFGWIETNITIGSTVRLLDTYGIVKGSQLVEAAGTYVDCWIVEMLISQYYNINYTMWYDKATGLWIGMQVSDPYYPDEYGLLFLLVDTNIPVGGALRLETDKPMYTRLELATITATYVIGKTPVEDAAITLQVDYPNGTLYFVWTVTTDANGTASFVFFIEENSPYGTYTLDATVYKPGLDPKTTQRTFIVAHLEPNVELWFEGCDIALVEHDTTILLHVQNTGNGTAYSVTTALSIPSSLTVISANTTFSGNLNPEHEVILVATVTASTPSRHLLVASTTFNRADGTLMPTVDAEKAIIFAYHEDYPVDLTDMTITATSEQITVNLTITNYGDSPIQVTLIASAQHAASKLMLRSAYQTVTINPNETATISLSIVIPSTAPSGEYIVQGILATQLPNQDGFTLVRKQETVAI